MSPDEFLVYQRADPYCPVGYGGLDGRVHCNYGGLIKRGFMGVGAGIRVDA